MMELSGINCLGYALLQWANNNTDLVLWYNVNHVVSIEPGIDLEDKGYSTFEKFGFNHFVSSFELDKTPEFKVLLKLYFQNKGYEIRD